MMTVVDVHVHVFERIAGIKDGAPITSTEHGRVKIGNRVVQFLPPSFEKSNSTVETLIAHMDWCGVDKALLVPNVLYGYHNEYVRQACDLYGDRLRAIALVDVLKGAEAREDLIKLVTYSGFRGLKIETESAFQCQPGEALDSPNLEPIWSCCNDLELPVMIHLSRPQDRRSLKNLVMRYRRIRFIICHLGNPPYDDWVDIVELALRKNVWMELSAMPAAFPEDEYPYVRACEYIMEAYRRLGPEKLMWGSDYPGILAKCTYQQSLEMFRKGCFSIPEAHKDLILGQNALNMFWS